jgi:Mrp family chromosome partitioning ATPase
MSKLRERTMGRILEALQQAARRGPAEPLPSPHDAQLDTDAHASKEPAEEVPFIEVGGPRSRVEASPSVLASVPETRSRGSVRQTPHKTPCRVENDDQSASPAHLDHVAGVKFLPLPREPLSGCSPGERFAAELITLHQPSHPISHQFGMVMNAMARQLPPGQAQVLLLAPAAAEVDSTAVLLNLAITCAKQTNQGVVVVDGKLGRATLAGKLGLSSSPGLGDVLAGTISIQRALQETGLTNLHALTAGTFAATNARQVAGEGMRAVLRYLRGRFSWVLVDAPCWDGRPDLAALGAACDAVYLVLPEAEAETPQIEELIRLVAEQGACLRGCVLTQI